MKRLRLENLSAAIDGTAIGFTDSITDIEFGSLSTDTRTIKGGELFWALKGSSHDGHDHVQSASQRGAIASVVDRGRVTTNVGPRIEVADTEAALLDFSRWYRQQFNSRVIGITGSVGKTTTRRMVHAVLSSKLMGVQSPKNFNNQFGVPFSVLQLDSQHEFAVLELAASQVGEIRELATVADPQVGILTAIAPAHLDGFGSVADVAKAKSELLQHLPESGFAVVNGDDTRCREVAGLAKCKTFFVGEAADNDLVATDIVQQVGNLSFTADEMRYSVPANGRHHLTAALAAITVAKEFGLDDDEIQSGLNRFESAAGRCQIVAAGDVTVVDDTYNSSPRSVQAACDLLQDWAGDVRRILVSG